MCPYLEIQLHKISSSCTSLNKLLTHLIQTSLYAQQFTEQEQNNLKPHSLVHQWKATDRAEILTLLAVVILMGVVHKPRFAMYWSTDSLSQHQYSAKSYLEIDFLFL